MSSSDSTDALYKDLSHNMTYLNVLSLSFIYLGTCVFGCKIAALLLACTPHSFHTQELES